MLRDDIPDLLVFKPTFDPLLEKDSSTYFAGSKTLRTPNHRNIVIKFVREQYPQAKFRRIYDATTDGWVYYDFHR
jgi:hypothetical protein